MKLKILIFVFLILMVFYTANIDSFVSYLAYDTAISALLVQPFIILSLYFSGIRLSLLSGGDKNLSISFLSGFKASIICYGFGLFLPARISEFLKPIYLRDRCKLPLSSGIAAVAFERFSDVIILACFAFLGALCFISINSKYLIVLILIAVAIPFLLFLSDKYFLITHEKLVKNFWIRFGISVLKSCFLKLRNKNTYIGLLFGFFAWCASFMGLIVYFKILGVTSLGLEGYLALFLGATISGSVPALPGGFGLYEGAVVYILGKYGVGFDEALVLAVGLHASQLIFSILGSVYLSLFEKMGITSILTEIKSINFKGTSD